MYYLKITYHTIRRQNFHQSQIKIQILKTKAIFWENSRRHYLLIKSKKYKDNLYEQKTINKNKKKLKKIQNKIKRTQNLKQNKQKKERKRR